MNNSYWQQRQRKKKKKDKKKISHQQVYYDSKKSSLLITGKVNSFTALRFIAAVNIFRKSHNRDVIVDFRQIERAFLNGMLPIIATIEDLRKEGFEVTVLMPENSHLKNVFDENNWSYFLEPGQFKDSQSIYNPHLVTRRFKDSAGQKDTVDQFIKMVIGTIKISDDIIRGLEWTVNEITDNVLNHSEADEGIFQAVVYPNNKYIDFGVVDRGIGIYNSLKPTFGHLNNDLQAISEAIKVGVTRDKNIGQGNGLAGTLRIASMCNGTFEVLSGMGRVFVSQDDKPDRQFNKKTKEFKGTFVAGMIDASTEFSIEKALMFGTSKGHVPSSVIDTLYEAENDDMLVIKMNEETGGFGSRKSGAYLRTKVINLMNSKPTYPIEINWTGIPLISSSFADEFMGKMFLELGMITFAAKVRNVGMEELIMKLLDKAAAQRLTQEKDEE